jgi:transcriptional regulator with XRE-family HTH domain
VTRPGRRRRADSRYAEQAARLAAQLRALREQEGLSQEQVAARAGVAVSTVRKIETGAVVEPGYFTVVAMMRALQVKDNDSDGAPTAGIQPQPGEYVVNLSGEADNSRSRHV